MPSVYTHALVARKTLQSLPRLVTANIKAHLPLYFFGAHGADFCFFYPLPSGYPARNLGSFLHRKGGYNAFRVCKALCNDQAIFAYTLGFITHYAADTVFHPYVYATAGNSPLRHSRIEQAFDLVFKKEYEKDEYAPYFLKMPTKKGKEDLFFLYTAIAANAKLPPLDKALFLQTFTLFNAYLSRPFSSFDENNAALLSALTNAQNREWTHPQKSSLKSHDGGKELFEKSVERSITLIKEFILSLRDKTPLPLSFAKNYLSGL